MEVSGGCFCCHFDDLNDRLTDLVDKYHPDLIFAESVGSCADVVATVVRPLLEMEVGAVKPGSYTVFADVRLLHRYLNGLEMPFSDGINYIFGKQIEEAGLLFINKTDLAEDDFVRPLSIQARESYPHTQVIAGSALAEVDIAHWIDGLQNGRYPPPQRSLEIDYDHYAAGESALGWVDREYHLLTDACAMQRMLNAILTRLISIIVKNGWVTGHVKVIITGSRATEKISLAQSGTALKNEGLQSLPGSDFSQEKDIHLLLNMLVEGNPQEILNKMHAGIKAIASDTGAELSVVCAFERVPGYPDPTHRIDN